MMALSEQEKAFDRARPLARLQDVPVLDERELVRELYKWGVWLGNDKYEAIKATQSGIHPLKSMMDTKKQDGEKTNEARAYSSTVNPLIMNRLNALITEGLSTNPKFRRPGSLPHIQAQIITVEFRYNIKELKRRVRKVHKSDGTTITRQYYTKQKKVALENLLHKYNDPNILIA